MLANAGFLTTRPWNTGRMPEANSVDAQSIQDFDRGALFQVLGVEVGAAVLVGQVAHDGVALPQRKSPSSITGTTPTGLILRNTGSSVGRKPRPQSSRSYSQAELVEHPQHLAHVDGVGASVDLEHRRRLPGERCLSS